MEKDVSSVSKHNATKTDLSLLLECLKYQMRCPDSQKQALLTIYSICQQREENVNFFREIGGVVFVYNLSKSSAHAEVRETALFILGMLAEANVYCKQALCRRELFSDLTDGLMQQDSPLTQRRVAVYLISVLVANNRSGQIFAQTTGCLDILLDLFRTSFPLSGKATVKPANITQLFQLWTSVSSALCGCVNNPQNEESQRICVSAFPLVKSWLQQLSHPQAEMVQPICSFIAMTVANNHCAQESFSIVGGLGTLTQTLIRFASDASHSPLACQLSVIMTKTVSACITDNPVLVSGLAGYGLVPPLISLLSSPILDPQGRLIIILTLGHCTEASEEHQSQLLQCGGLSLIITLLTESTSEELRKAATFILQTCKQASESVSLRGAVQGMSLGQTGELEPPVDMERYWRSARDMLHRINQLERQQTQGAEEEWEEDTPNPPDQQNPAGLGRKELLSPIPLPPTPHHTSLPYQERRGGGEKRCEESWRGVERRDQQRRYGKGGEKGEERRKAKPHRPRTAETSTLGGDGRLCQPRAMLDLVQLVSRGSPVVERMRGVLQVFKCPAPGKPGLGRQKKLLDDEGCRLRFSEVTSRSFPVLQRSCPHSCDLHMVLQQATHSYTKYLREIRRRRDAHTTKQREGGTQSVSDHCRGTLLKSFSTHRGQHRNDHNDVSLTPLKKRSPYGDITLTPVRRGGLMRSVSSVTSRRQERGDVSLTPLKKARPSEGRGALPVSRFGLSWNTILWSYPFQPGRTNVDLAKTYKHLQAKFQGMDSTSP
ncbi:telomere repeats-binding bouquet formation protein 1 [Salvelinus namaycush]|uniref:Telomere repeats-binding bouquet formation protein 1 n=1 Tax=Salvelinus namaycush TaxID=8040 RepID=A0A8U1BYM5_SALNM|nr:telomere repeats-binding bouquet formation protein 1 [Salvelinus namaycush]